MRFARVTVRMNIVGDKIFQDYVVGPLPINHETNIRPLSYVYNSGRSSTTTRLYGSDMNALQSWLDNIAHEVSDVIEVLFLNGTDQPDSEVPIFDVSSLDQPTLENGCNVRWILFSQVFEAPTLLPQALYFKANTTGRDPKNWNVMEWLYNDIIYATAEDLRMAFRSPHFEILPSNIDGNWTYVEPEERASDFPYSHEAPPTFVQTGKSRISIDKEEGFISWMGFSLNIAFSQINGQYLYLLYFSAS
jgi:primary-amine oxidase